MEELTAPKVERRRRRTRRKSWIGRRWSDVALLVVKFLAPLVALLYGYDFVRVDNDNFTMRRVQVESRSADERMKALEEKLDALLRERDDSRDRPSSRHPHK